MTTIALPKNIEDIQEPEALPEDYYKLRIVEEPLIASNKKKKDGGPDAPGAGDNLVLSLRVISEDPEYNGRPFKKWLGIPSEADKTDIMQSGQTKEDAKISMLARTEEGFSGSRPDGNEINLRAGMECWIYVTQTLDQSGTKFVNDLDFMQELKPVN